MRRSFALVSLLTTAAVVATLGVLAATEPSSAGPDTDHRADATAFVFVRPVTTEGRPAPGWRVHRESGSADCFGASPSAVNPGIVSCYPTAYALRACWKSQRHTVLCVRDARRRSLVRIRYSGDYPHVHARHTPTPMDLTLDGGRKCLIRFGGAWSAPESHPRWIGFDSCTDGTVYGPPKSKDGINRSNDLWTVHVWREPQDDIVERAVTTAYFVGTAAA